MTRPRPGGPGQWVLLSYRMPREPSTRRIAVWRKVRGLGVAQISDGLVALPADARTREHFDWLAEEIRDGGGTAAVWIATPTAASTERDLATAMATARAVEYTAILDEATAALATDPSARASVLRRLRAELRRVVRRDYFPARSATMPAAPSNTWPGPLTPAISNDPTQRPPYFRSNNEVGHPRRHPHRRRLRLAHPPPRHPARA